MAMRNGKPETMQQTPWLLEWCSSNWSPWWWWT